MNFIKKLIPTKDTTTLVGAIPFNEDTTFRMFNAIKINEDLWMSIQASYAHYCSPRKTLKDLSEYDSMEFALMDKEGNFVSVKDVLPNFPKFKEIEEYHETVYAYVPVNLIDELFEALNN